MLLTDTLQSTRQRSVALIFFVSAAPQGLVAQFGPAGFSALATDLAFWSAGTGLALVVLEAILLGPGRGPASNA